MVADRDVDKVADKCIKPEMFLNEVYWAEAVWFAVYPTCVSSKHCEFIIFMIMIIIIIMPNCHYKLTFAIFLPWSYS